MFDKCCLTFLKVPGVQDIGALQEIMSLLQTSYETQITLDTLKATT